MHLGAYAYCVNEQILRRRRNFKYFNSNKSFKKCLFQQSNAKMPADPQLDALLSELSANRNSLRQSSEGETAQQNEAELIARLKEEEVGSNCDAVRT